MAIAIAVGGTYWPSIAVAPNALSFVLLLAILYLLHSLITTRIRSGSWLPRRLSAHEWAQQLVVVTGAAGGVGAELILLLVRKGARVAALDIKPLSAEVHDRLAAEGLSASVLQVQCDVSSLEAVRQAADAVHAHWRDHQVTMLVNNAGVATPPQQARYLGEAAATQQEEDNSALLVERTIRVNLLSHLWTLRTFLPEILEGDRGHIVTVSSLMAHIGVPGLGDYVASKWGLVGLHETLCREIATRSSSSPSPGTRSSPNRQHATRTQTTLVLPAHISTPLFPHWSYPPFLAPLFPTVSAEHAAGRIVEAMGSGRSSYVYMPRTTWLVGFMGALPEWMREGAQWASGADVSVANMAAKAAKAA
ncbi:NAD(P)-binding protein [Jaminaea rosea]|uniref:NAD(P)-binding protein n=1 Tax=Jaminaea rosea TaxID=1569628 RepID=A0A316UPF7_9BASI|nr:NAD(P)-binding protein [Jaminaea rosea]PWN26854.1 NAD(P)-binding protein [Jaminaea rosea]